MASSSFQAALLLLRLATLALYPQIRSQCSRHVFGIGDLCKQIELVTALLSPAGGDGATTTTLIVSLSPFMALRLMPTYESDSQAYSRSDSYNSSFLMEKFKSKKAIHSSKQDLQSDQVTKSPDPNPWSSKTPEKFSQPPLRRGRSQSTVMSLKEVRQFAQKLQRSGSDPSSPPNRVSSEKEQISSDPVDNPVVKPKKTIESAKLPENLDSSIRLIQLKGGSCSLSNISPKIECV